MRESVKKFNAVSESFDRIKLTIKNTEDGTLAEIKKTITRNLPDNEQLLEKLFGELSNDIKFLKTQIDEVTV